MHEQEKALSALPPTELIPGPQLMSVGFSLAGAVSARTRDRVTICLTEFASAATEVRTMFRQLRAAVRDEPATDASVNATQIRIVLDRLLQFEHALPEADETLSRLLADGRLQQVLDEFALPGIADVRAFKQALKTEFLPLLRDLRLHAICFAADQARAAGVNVLDLPADFAEQFRNASLAETESWQETAFLLADVENARRLSESIVSAALDRTEAFEPASLTGLS